MKRILIPAIFFSMMLPGISQQSKMATPNLHSAIKVKAKAYSDSVVVRWAPADAWAWVLLNTTGYIVERTDYSNAARPKKEILATVKPYTLEKFKTVFGPNDKYAAIAAQALYGKNFSSGIRNGNLSLVDQAAVLNDRHAFALQASDYDGRVALAAGLKWTDKTAVKDKFYTYKIFPAGQMQGVIDTGRVFIQNKIVSGIAPPQLSEAIGLDHLIELHWNRFQQDSYSGFIIEKSTDGKNFTAVNNIPYFSSLPDSAALLKDTVARGMYDMLKQSHIMMDSVKENYTNYYYRIKGVNAFAEWSGYSKPVVVMTRDMKPPSTAVVGKPEYLDKKRIKLQWVRNITEPDFKGYTVSRATNVQGPYELLTKNVMDKTTTSFVDDNAVDHEENFYIVSSIDTAGNQAPSYPVMGLVPDNDPPSVPTGLKGSIDKKGYVYLHWNAGKENDIKGYKVYFSNSQSQTLSQLTLEPVADTVFIDTITLKTLTKDIYYKVVAVDLSNNHSDFSVFAKLRKPDIVPPMPPVAGTVEVTEKAVNIEWMQSSSDDAVGYAIFRSEKNGIFQSIARIKHKPGNPSFIFSDTTVKALVDYKYTAETIDEDSLHSAKSNAVPVIIRTLPEQPPVKGLTAVYDNKTKKVQLKWQYRQNGEYFFIIYKAVGNEALAKYSSAQAIESDWTESPYGESGVLKYAIQAVFKDSRGQTKLSDPVQLSIPK